MFIKKTVISTRFKSIFIASMFSMCSAYVLMLTDNFVAGQFIGNAAVSAMTLIFPIFTMVVFVAYIISDGLAIMASYAKGKNDREEVNNLFSLGIILSVSCSLILFTALYFLREEILIFWDISEHLKFFAREYYSGVFFCALVQIISIFNYAMLFTEGMERACIIAASLSFVVNVILDIVLCQSIGVRGIGLATTFGTLSAVLVQLYYLNGGRSRLHFRWYWNLKKTLRGMLYSFYHSIDTLCLSLLPMILSMQVLKYFGEEKLIIVTIAVNLLTLVMAIFTSLTDCLQPMVCQYHAENNLQSKRKTIRLGIKSAIVISLIIIFVEMIFVGFLPEMFGVKEQKLIDEATEAMRHFLPFIIFFGCTTIFANYYIYVEKGIYGTTIKFLLLLVFPVLGIFLVGNLSLNIFWMSIGISFAAVFIINYILTKRSNGLFMINEKDLSRQISYDINTTFEEVIALTKKIDADLMNRGVDDKIKNKIVMCVEEFGLHAVERAGKNIFQLEISILLEDDVIIVIRDNGKPYDIIKNAQEGKFNFREFIIEGITSKFSKRDYTFSGDENRITLKF